MRKEINTTNVGENQVRHDIRLSGSVSPGEGVQGFANLIMLMRHVVDQPDLIRHGGDCPALVTFEYDGGAWFCHAVCFATKEK
jgi:hypothetical protein